MNISSYLMENFIA